MDVGLSLALGTIAAGVALAESVIAGRGAFWTRLGVELACLSVLSTVLAERVGSPFAPAFLSGSAPQRLVEQVLAVAWWGMAARVAVTLARLLVTHEARPRESRIVSDLLAAVIYVAAALGVVAF
ncbi:MAG: hypothetical protein INR65_11000, partial [Gluconacetobacter diazotrophicus]|nr:hypothetical protein [Gluconacetobacter diazotrophicus]